MRNRGRRRFHSAQDSSVPRPQGPGPRRDQRRPRRPQGSKPQGEIIFGVEPVRELLAASPGAIQTLFIKNGLYERFGDEIEKVREAGGKVVRAEDADLARMAGSEGRHQGIVASIREYAYVPLEELLEQQPDPLLIVDGVTDPRNLGAIMRSAECAGARALILARDRTTGVTPAAVKASSGAWVHLKIARCGNVGGVRREYTVDKHVACKPVEACRQACRQLHGAARGRREALVLERAQVGVFPVLIAWGRKAR